MSEPGSATGTDDESAARRDDTPAPKPRPEAAPKPPRRRRAATDSAEPWWVRHYTFTGTAVGLIFIWFSMTPSLLPRGALFQGLVSGVSGAIGYGLGVFAVWLVRYMRSKDSSPPAPRWAWMVLIPVGVRRHGR